MERPRAAGGGPGSLTITTRSADETRRLGERLARTLRPGCVVLLFGDLGAGKTTLTQGIGRGLGVADTIQSPTFTLANEYETDGSVAGIARLYHLDLYRLAGPADLDSVGFDDYLGRDDGVVVVEWPERAGELLPARYLLLQLDQVPEGRRIVLEIHSPDGGVDAPVEALRAVFASA